MHLAAVDNMSNNGKSFIHKAKPITKVLMAGLFLAGIIASDNLVKLGFLLLIVFILITLSRVNIKEIMHLALYPVFFSMVFALLKVQESWAAGAVVMLKALSAAMSMLLLISTTSYVDIFSIFSLFMPSIIVDIFIFTYRSLFILLDKLENLLKSIKLRGGYHPLGFFSNLKNVAGALGIMIIHSFDMSDRLYRIYALRGYNGHIPITRDWWPLRFSDIILLTFSIIVLVGMVIPWSI